MRRRNPFLVALAVVAWILFCGSLTLMCGSGAEQWPVEDEPDVDMTMFWAGVIAFGVAGVIGWGLRLTRAGREEQESRLGCGLAFLVGTPIVAMIAGLVIDILK